MAPEPVRPDGMPPDPVPPELLLPESITPVMEAVAPVTRRFADAGHRLYLVGGIVRDLLAGRPVRRQDLDLTTDAEPTVVKELVSPISTSLWTQGERFGTIGCIVGGQDLEITTHRAEQYTGSTRKPTVEFSDDVVADLSRRDFTVNAIAIEVTSATPRLIDPFDGAGDLTANVLRTPLDPMVSFSDDPLRMLRAARFIAGFALVPVPELAAAVTELRERMSIVSRERVREELVKLLALADPTSGLDFLAHTGLLEIILPELAARAAEADPTGCHPDLLTHTVAVVTAAAPGATARLAALLAEPAALAPLSAETDASGRSDQLGARLRSLRFSNGTTTSVSTAVRAQRALDAALDHGDDATLRRLAVAASGEPGDALDLVRAEATARAAVDDGALGRSIELVAQRLDALATTEDLHDLGPTVDGAAVMIRLGLRPGRDVGAALRHLAERRIELGPRDAAAELDDLERWWSARTAAGPGAAPTTGNPADRSDPDVP